MSWEKVIVKIGNQDIHAMYNGEILQMPNADIKETIKVNGKEMQVVSSIVDHRDNIIKIKLAKASQPKGEKSDGKEQTKG